MRGDAIIEKLNTPVAFILALVLVLAIDGFLFYRYRLIEENTATVSPTTTASEATQAPSTSSKQQGTTTVEETKQPGPATPGKTIAATAPKMDMLRVGIRVVDAPSWLLIQVDGQTILEGIMEPGFSRELEANEEVSIQTGNAGAVEVEVDGQNQGRLGASGESASRTFRR